MSTIQVFDYIENKYTLYRGEDCTSVRGHAKNVTNFEKKKMLTLSKKQRRLHQDVIECYIYGKIFLKKFVIDKNYQKVRDHCHLQVNTEVYHIVYVT